MLFAANAGSGTVSVFRVFRSSLLLVDQVPSGGSEPLSVAKFGNLVYVLNSAGSGSIVAFNLRAGVHLQQIENSTTYLTATNSGGSSLSISPNMGDDVRRRAKISHELMKNPGNIFGGRRR